MIDCLYFGCWNTAGHYLWGPGGDFLTSDMKLDGQLDGKLAPRVYPSGRITWASRSGEDKRVEYRTTECPQGQFLLHKMLFGHTAMAWWDRNQGDRRGACNCVLLLRGDHNAEEMIAALQENFPHVMENLKKGGFTLMEVHPSP